MCVSLSPSPLCAKAAAALATGKAGTTEETDGAELSRPAASAAPKTLPPQHTLQSTPLQFLSRSIRPSIDYGLSGIGLPTLIS